ncbi:hypothetical protein PPYR_05719 [Photinus pyralis]|uniref:Peptidase S1 domain-containing protein n=1 Tax=Photinus pyralis TaxID=7054 RepID=A0A5N4AVG7_PHOPY|nr:uncharacterized protein LOC116166018 isoform X2 [Photinus pyralis]KAB0801365.1 hypothetical protein PPYR_05719 [Photinus pyralis]
MESFCASAPRSKRRAALTSSSFYQTSPYSRNLRQNEYSLPSRSHHNPFVWHQRTHLNNEKPKSKVTSVALAAAAFLVFVTVLSIAGLALYMGVLRSEAPTQLLTFNCSAKVLRGDRFLNNLQDKARKYKQQLEALYHRSSIGPALVSCTVEKFGDDTVTIYFRISLNRKALPRSISNLEKVLRDALINDSITRRPIFRHVRFDPKSIQIRQTLDVEAASQKVITKTKEGVKPKNTVLLKPNQRTNTSALSNVPNTKQTNPDDTVPKKPSLHGSFEISKTDADITEKKNARTTTTLKPKWTTGTSIPKLTYVTSHLFQVAAISTETVKTTSQKTPSSTTESPKTSIVTTTSPDALTTSKRLQSSNLYFFTIPSHSLDKEPWVPIQGTSTQNNTFPKVEIKSQIELLRNKPVYTSFTNPGLSYHSTQLERLGATEIVGHPLPVDKIAAVTETHFITTSSEDEEVVSTTKRRDFDREDMQVSEDQSGAFVEVETLKHVPGASVNNTNETDTFPRLSWELLNGTGSQSFSEPENTLMKTNLKHNETNMSIFRNLASSVLSTTTISSTIPQTPRDIPSSTLKEHTEAEGFVEGHAEVVEVEEDAITLESRPSTKVPLVTLLPVKSNSGISRPLRPRPQKPANQTDSVENRSFPSDPFIKNVNSDVPRSPIKFIHTEVVTSLSTEISRGKISKSPVNDFKISGVLNFEKEHESLTRDDSVAEAEVNRNPKMDPKESHANKELEMSIFSVNSSVSIGKSGTQIKILSEDKLKQLSEISKLRSNISHDEDAPVISNKAISASYTHNQAGLKILTKTLNKVSVFSKEDEHKSAFGGNTVSTNTTECSNYTIKCGDGQCLPDTTRCNQLVDCNDGTDEKNCTCADYLKSQYLLRKICDGVVDCWDFSDENLCDWCKPGQYVCANSKFCIDTAKLCDGSRDCPNGDDERHCVTVAPTLKAANEYPYYSEGYLLVRKYGRWGKLCMNNEDSALRFADLGQAVCNSRTYKKLDVLKIDNDTDSDHKTEKKYFELAGQMVNVPKSNLTFNENECPSKRVMKIRCNVLECGTRPQAVNQLARIVGGGNAGLGSWPWQAALYKEGEFQCGATLLTSRWLLSAGHCFFHSLEDHWVARMGTLRRGTALPSPYEQLRPITQIILHPGYVDVGFINDISLLQTETPLIFSDYVRPICLPVSDSELKDNRICTVIGWGQLFEVGRIFPDTLQEVQVPVISTSECRKHTLFLPLYKITDDMFCAGYDRGGRDACLGDSGGPLMCSEPDGRWVLYGITSNGYGCARANRPGVYTKVSNYLPWIRSHIDDNEKTLSPTTKNTCQGHRCPLGECLPKSRLCNGYIECSDGSDEKDCPEN